MGKELTNKFKCTVLKFTSFQATNFVKELLSFQQFVHFIFVPSVFPLFIISSLYSFPELWANDISQHIQKLE